MENALPAQWEFNPGEIIVGVVLATYGAIIAVFGWLMNQQWERKPDRDEVFQIRDEAKAEVREELLEALRESVRSRQQELESAMRPLIEARIAQQQEMANQNRDVRDRMTRMENKQSESNSLLHELIGEMRARRLLHNDIKWDKGGRDE